MVAAKLRLTSNLTFLNTVLLGLCERVDTILLDLSIPSCFKLDMAFTYMKQQNSVVTLLVIGFI